MIKHLMNETLTIMTCICLGIALAAASGMRIFLLLLLSAIVGRFGLFGISSEVTESQAWLGSNGALLCFGIAHGD